MFLPYKLHLNFDGSYSFISSGGNSYLIYFSESTLPDSHGNNHIVYNFGFSRDGDFSCEPYKVRYDGRIKATIIFVLHNFFKKGNHRTLVYFCFNEDRYARHRNIVFNQWHKDLNNYVEKHSNIIYYEGNQIYGSLIILQENPLKELIIAAFDTYIQELKNI